MTWKMQNYGDRKRSMVSRGWDRREEEMELRGFLGHRNYDTTTVDAGQNPQNVQHRVNANGNCGLQVIVTHGHRPNSRDNCSVGTQDVNSKGNSGAG